MKKKVLTVTVSSALAIVILFASITTLALQPSIINTSYNEYLSVERPISRFYTIDLGFVFYIDEESGYLYKLDLETDESTLLLEASVKENIEYGDRVYCILQDNKIVSMKYDGSDLQTHYQGNAEVKTLWTDGEALFFQHGNSICRYHIPSKVLDTLVTSNLITYFRPVSNLKIEWTEYTPEWIKYVNSDEYEEDAFAMYGTYPGFEGEMIVSKSYHDNENIVTVLGYEIDFGDSSLPNELMAVSPGSLIINGKNFPLSEYPVGSFFSRDRIHECDCPNHTECVYYIICDCEIGTNRSGGDCIQCVGFAYTAYREIWDQETANFVTFVTETPSVSFTTSSSDLVELKEFFQSLDRGSMTIAYKRGGGQHAFVIAYTAGNYVAVYDANGTSEGGNCEISYHFVTYEYLQERYHTFDYIYQAPDL